MNPKKDLERVVALCRRDPEVASLVLLIVACIYGIGSLLVGMVGPETDLSVLARLLWGSPDTIVTNAIDGDQITRALVALLHAWLGTVAVMMALAGFGMQIALGLRMQRRRS